MNLNTQKKIAAKILKCGKSKIWMDPTAQEKISHAITRRDVRGLIKDGLVKKLSDKKSMRAGPKRRLVQKLKGRRSGSGRRKGAIGARVGKKEKWLKIVRPQRNLLSMLRKEKRINDYGTLYKQVKGNMFRSKHHLVSHLEEHKLAKISLSEFEAAEKARNMERKKQMKIALKKFAENVKTPEKTHKSESIKKPTVNEKK